MKRIDPKELTPQSTLSLLTGAIGPRPIALVSTLSADGIPNLAPFSFFNAFGSNPPMVAFSPARRARNGATKDTYNNLMATKECVIQVVTHAMVEQVNLASTEYPPGVNEFIKSGLTPMVSEIVKPARVKESPFQMECVLHQMVHLGDKPGSGNLAICEVKLFHVEERVFKDGIIHPSLTDLVARNGGDFYTRASGDAIFEVRKPVTNSGMGVDQLPAFIRNSKILTGNNLGQLGNTEKIPTAAEVQQFINTIQPTSLATEELFHAALNQKNHTLMLQMALTLRRTKHPQAKIFLEQTAQCALANTAIDFAWKVLLHMVGPPGIEPETAD